jgi:TatD DNase family protein
VIDTHAHLDACASPPDELIERARAAGVGRIVTIGSGIASCREALRICEGHPEVRAALGIHPHQAADASDADLAELRALLARPRTVAVGEAGLDYYRDYAPRETQREVFRKQALLATELGKPLVVHSRAADDDTVAVLAEAAPPAVILHCFSSPALLPLADELGYYVSFAGNVTYPKAVELRLAACRARADRLLAETDSPYLAPQAHRGRPNEPSFVVHVLEALARARGQSPHDLERTIDENAARVFGLEE